MVLCTQQRWLRVLGQTSSTACQKPSAPSATASSGPRDNPRPPEVEQQLPPGLHALAHAIGQANKLLLALRGGADDHEKALGVRLKAGLHMDAVDPEVDVAFGREVSLGPPGMLARPSLLQSGDTRGGQPTGVRAKQRRERVLKVAARDALEVQDQDQNLEALGAPGIGRQDRGREPDAGAGPYPVRPALTTKDELPI